MGNLYVDLIKEGNVLKNTYTISYDVGEYKEELFSSTYDELSNWVKKALKIIESSERQGRECSLYKHVSQFRGRAGDLTLSKLKQLIKELEEAK